MFCIRVEFLLLMSASLWCICLSTDNDLLLVTVATEENDALRRYIRSANKYGLDTKVFGIGEEWKGGNLETGTGGGQKINILKRDLAPYKDRENLLVMFTDSYDVVLTAGKDAILEKFSKLNAGVVFSAEGFCWPDKSLADKYPEVKLNEKRFLCSGGFIGHVKDVYEILTHTEVENQDDDQLYYTQIFLNEKLRNKYNIKLDKKAELFMNLHGCLGDIMLKFKGSHSFLYNIKTGTMPVVIHGNGPIKPEFNRLANYLADGWTTSAGCLSCQEDTINLEGLQEDDYPTILLGVFIEKATPFITEFFEHIAALDYPKSKIDLFVHNAMELHNSDVSNFQDSYASKYNSMSFLNPFDSVAEASARNWALEGCKKKDCQYYFNVDADVHLDNDQTLKLLIQQNRSVLAPVVTRWGKAWSNFWGALSNSGFYARSEDYMEIVHGDKVGLWNIPYMSGVYLIQRHVLLQLKDGYASNDLDADMSLCKAFRDKNIFMYVTNGHTFGHMVDSEAFETTHTNNELYEIFNNPHDWEIRYIHPQYADSLKEGSVVAEPCPDVFWFPIVTDQFCDELVGEMEAYGGWSGGKSEDSRLAGGYENVPTDDIHSNQIGFEKHWLEVLRLYVAPLVTRVFEGYYSNDARLSTGYENVPTDDIHLSQVGLQDAWLEFLRLYVQPLTQKVFMGYYQDPPRALLMFVVKYHPSRQRLLRPHHDSSTYSINIALNTPKLDFEGGGTRFLRQNCSVTDQRKGWMLMHPGRLTHFHEGLPVTAGTRYIMVSFIDP